MPRTNRKTVRRDKVEIYLHLMWTTWDRLPLIEPQWQHELYVVIYGAIEQERCEVIAINGIEDHVHVLVKIRSTTRTCDLIKAAKALRRLLP